MVVESAVPVRADVVEEFVPAGGVVVGDDGTDTSRAAVRWAALDAARRGTVLHVVRCWSLVTAPRSAASMSRKRLARPAASQTTAATSGPSHPPW